MGRPAFLDALALLTGNADLSYPTGQWHAASSGGELYDKARQQAIAIHDLVQACIEPSLAVQSRTFGQIAYEELDVMDRKVGSGEGKKTYADYTFALKKCPIPFFGKTEVSQISVEMIRGPYRTHGLHPVPTT